MLAYCNFEQSIEAWQICEIACVGKLTSTQNFKFMKKNFSSRVLPVLCFVATFALGCGGDDDPPTRASCEKNVSAFQTALNNLMADIENSDKCRAFKAAAAELLDCPGITAGEKAEYQSTVDSMVCD